MKRRLRWCLLGAAVVAVVWLAPDTVTLPFIAPEGYKPTDTPMSFPPSKVVRDDRPVFHIDPGRPWRIDFGRGSGWHGLATVTLDQTGRLVLYRHSRDEVASSWETAVDELPPEAVAAVLDAVASNQLTGLDREYHADVHDGTQWIVWIRQGEREKAVYFNNHFPDAIVRFAARVDEIVATGAGARLRWRPLLSGESDGPGGELWDSIRR